MSEENETMNVDEGYNVPLKDRTIQTQASDPPISDLCDRITKGRLEVQADFQRNYVWENKAELKSKLIESVLLKVPNTIRKFTLQRSVAILRTNLEIIPNYLCYFMLTSYFQKQLLVRTNSTAQAGVYLGEIGSIPIFYSNSKEEQQKIVSILLNTDSYIHKQQNYKSKLETIKQGLMQKLLSGKIRVKI